MSTTAATAGMLVRSTTAACEGPLECPFAVAAPTCVEGSIRDMECGHPVADVEVVYCSGTAARTYRPTPWRRS